MHQFYPKSISITPTYLIELSKHVDILNTFYQQEQLNSLTSQFTQHLNDSFSILNKNLILYVEDAEMTQSSVLKCKSMLEGFVWQKLVELLSRESKELGKMISELSKQMQESVIDFQKIVLAERNKQIVDYNEEKNKVIANLRREVIVKRQYTQELEDRVRDLEIENSSIYNKLITNAKNTVDYTLQSPKPKSQQSPGISKLKMDLNHSHKSLTAKQAEEIIYDIMENKVKQENVKGKHTSVNNYLKTYFRFKFGMKELAEESQINFREAIVFYARTQQKNIFILFQCIIDEQCEEAYFFEYKNLYQRITKYVKRYMNEKEGISVNQLDKLFDSKIIDERTDINLSETDVQYILVNAYKTTEVDSLQMIFNEIISDKVENSSQGLTVPSKKLLNEILNFELKKHTLRVEDIVREIRQIDEGKRGYLTYDNISTILVRLKISEEKYDFLIKNYPIWQDKFFTYSEAIDILDKIRKTKTKRKQ